MWLYLTCRRANFRHKMRDNNVGQNRNRKFTYFARSLYETAARQSSTAKTEMFDRFQIETAQMLNSFSKARRSNK